MKRIIVLFTAIMFIFLITPQFNAACEQCGNPTHRPSIQQVQGSIPQLIVIPSSNITGDLRLRYEGQETGGQYSGQQSYRARLGISLDVNEKTTAVIGLSTNTQNICGWTETDGIYLDLANVQYSHTNELALIAGKAPVNFYRPYGSELLWDDDVRASGFGLSFLRDYDDLSLFVNAGYYNELLCGGQIGTNLDLFGLDVTVGYGYYDYENGTETNNELFTTIRTDFLGLPIVLTNDYVWNDNDKEAYLIGVEVQDVGPLTLYTNYRSVDGAIDTDLTDRNYINNGHEAGIKIGVAKNISVDVNVLTEDFNFEEDYRVQSDLTFYFN